MPRFAANLGFLFTEVPFLERFQAASDAGFRAVECPFGQYDESPADLAAALQAAGVQCVLVNTPKGRSAGAADHGAAVPGIAAVYSPRGVTWSWRNVCGLYYRYPHCALFNVVVLRT